MSVFELMAFLAILFRSAAKGYVGAMRLVRANRFGNPDIKAIMLRNRFLEIKMYLHFDNKDTRKDTRKERIQTDKFDREAFRECCFEVDRTIYGPGKDCSHGQFLNLSVFG